jgi:hypothetical protein
MVVHRAALHAKDAGAAERCMVLTLQARGAGLAGEIDKALDLLEQLRKIPENELTPDVIGLAGICETHVRFEAGQFDLCEIAGRKATRIFEKSGDVWSQADIQSIFFEPPLYCGRPMEAEKWIADAIPKAARVGHDSAKVIALWQLTALNLAKGKLQAAERAAREALLFAESCHWGWLFVVQTSLAGILLYQDQTKEVLPLLTMATTAPTTFFRGFPEGLLALSLSAAAMEGAADACTVAMQFLPRPGTSRGFGAWHAVLSLTEALCLAGRREEAGDLQAETEKIAAEWNCNQFGFPAETAAGIAAACSGNWTSAEEHHHAAIARMDAVPYVTAQPIARYWYADMLAQRGGLRDLEAAKVLLQESIAASDAIGLALYARLARQRLAQVA